MASRTVRLDDEAEQVLAELRRKTGMTISATLKSGLLALLRGLRREPSATAWEVYEGLDLGPGGYARSEGAGAKRAVREVIRRKHRR